MNTEALVALIQLYLGVLAGILIIISMTALVKGLDGLKWRKNKMSNFDNFIEDASRLTFEMYDDYTLEEMANRLSFKIFECRSVFHTLPKNTRMLYIIAYNETIHEIRRRNEQ